MRLQKDAQFNECQRLHSEEKSLEEKLDTYPPNTFVLMGESIVNGGIERDLSRDWLVKVRKFLRATINNLPHHVLPTIWKQPKPLVIHAGTKDAVKFISGDILNKLLQFKSVIQEKLPNAKITMSTPTLRLDND